MLRIRTAGVVLLTSAAGILLGAQAPGWQANPDVVRKTSEAQPDVNYDESRVSQYTLPDPLLTRDGVVIRSRDEWPRRRAEILDLFREHVYGRRPGKPDSLRFDVIETPNAMDGAATLTRVTIASAHQGREHRFELLLFLPNARAGAVPVFLLINNRPASNTDPTRAEKSPFWPAEELIARGYGIAAIQTNDLAPDDPKRFTEGVIRLFEGDTTAADRPGDAWRALAAWGWGASRAFDYFETDPRVDATRVALVGHSRGGKASLWAGAQDERFAIVVSNESGEGGASLARRNFGETIRHVNASFPHWFAGNYTRFNDRVDDLPVDQHMLLALVAPRALYVASADEDLWCDPRGEFLALVHTSPVFALWGDPPIAAGAMPPLEAPIIIGRRGYHVRRGGHNLTPYDWMRFADFADAQGWK